MTFSGALTLTDLNDFITPSQACIKPVHQLNPESEKDPGAAATDIQIDRNGTYYEVSQNGVTNMKGTSAPARKLEQAQINLNDCLACSGCITSAESVLITLQSHTEVLTFLEANKNNRDSSLSTEPYKVPIISVSPQSLASLASAVAAQPASTSVIKPSESPTPHQILHRVRAFCTEVLGFACVFDTTFARHITLREHIAEFEERWRAAGEDGEGSTGAKAGEAAKGLPMLASACPGWICYAEKAHSEMLPFISRTKSPQQVMGTLVKNWMGAKWSKSPNEIYHVTVMPCYDKKLEASRTDFYNDVYATRDVDCVITTGELELLMKERSWDITQPVSGELDTHEDLSTKSIFNPAATSLYPAQSTVPTQPKRDEIPLIHLPELLTHPGTSSGSYLQAIVTHLQTTSPVPLTLHVQSVRGADYEEYTLTKTLETPGQDEVVVFKGAKCYGFRNLQNVVRRVGRERGVRTTTGAAGRLGGRSNGGGGGIARRLAGRRAVDGKEEKKERNYDYVEVMACPGGCVNGGGQLKPIVSNPDNAAPFAQQSQPMIDLEGYKRDWNSDGVMVVEPLPTPKKEPAPIDVTQNARWGSKEWTKRVEEAYWREPFTEVRNRLADWLVQRIHEDLCGFGDESEKVETRRRFFRTEYRAVESEVVGLAVVW